MKVDRNSEGVYAINSSMDIPYIEEKPMINLIQRVNRIETDMNHVLECVCRACAERVNIPRIIISPVPTMRESILSM